ncbi:MAG: signal peptidase II [Candidatus Dasytiphilus stammeri]
MNFNKILSWIPLIIFIVILDFISKQWIIKSFKLGQVVSLTPFFNIIYIQNYGVAFNLFANTDRWTFWLLIMIQIILILSCIIIYTFMQKTNLKDIIGWELIISGSLGNGLDRILHGFVVDFINFNISNNFLYLPIFNLADTAICIGIILILINNRK